jgi:curved DNA-binding protein CbpA
MGAGGSRVWSEICAIDSDEVRAAILTRVLAIPDYVAAARAAGIYETVAGWLAAYQQGFVAVFPYKRSAPVSMPSEPIRDRIEHDTGGGREVWQRAGRWSAATAAPAPALPYIQVEEAPTTEIIVSPAAKALDYFQESLELLGISESEPLTHERLKSAYRRASLAVHPDKGGSPEQFDAVRRAYQYVGRILDRVRPATSAEETARMTAPVSLESAKAARVAVKVPTGPPVSLSAKKLDMSAFNQLFEESRLPDPERDSGYGDWLRSQGGADAPAADPRLRGKFNQQMFESVFQERALAATGGAAITRREGPDALVPLSGTELGGETKSFTSAMGAETQFMDLKDAYTTGATVYQEVAGVRISERPMPKTAAEARRRRDADMERVVPDEGAQIAAAAAAMEERERARRLRLAAADEAGAAWSEAMRRRLMVTNN